MIRLALSPFPPSSDDAGCTCDARHWDRTGRRCWAARVSLVLRQVSAGDHLPEGEELQREQLHTIWQLAAVQQFLRSFRSALGVSPLTLEDFHTAFLECSSALKVSARARRAGGAASAPGGMRAVCLFFFYRTRVSGASVSDKKHHCAGDSSSADDAGGRAQEGA